MKLTRDVSLSNFEFWSGAKDLVDKLSDKELDQIEGILEESYPDGMTDSELNDLFWFDGNMIAEWLGYEKEDDILLRDDPDHWFSKAAEMIGLIMDEIVPEFEEKDLTEFFERTGMDMDQFLHEDGYKQYIAEISDCSIEEAEENDYFSDYEDTVKYLQLGEWKKEAEDSQNVTDREKLKNTVVMVLREQTDELDYDDKEKAEKIADELDTFDLETDLER